MTASALKRPASSWPRVEADLRRTLVAAGQTPAASDRVLSDLAPVYLAVERARVSVELELVWALVGVAADRARRRAQNEKLAGRCVTTTSRRPRARS